MTKRTRHLASAKDSNPPLEDAAPDRVVTTLALPTEIWTQLKIRAVQERRMLRDICQRAIVAYLQTPVAPADRDRGGL